jgi:hypothetical protein
VGEVITFEHASRTLGGYVSKPTGDPALTPDEWNNVEIRCEGRALHFLLNGRPVNRLEANRAIIAYPGFNSFRDGTHFRNVHVVRLHGADGFEPLFNGKDLTGWKDAQPGSGREWRVNAEGALEGHGGSDAGKAAILISERQDFANFVLRATVRFPGCGAGRFIVRHTEPGDPRRGYHIQAFAPGNFPIGRVGKFVDQTGDMGAKAAGMPFPDDRWHTFEITANGNQITTSIDGWGTLDSYQDPDALYQSGQIGIACFPNWLVQIKGLYIKELPAATQPRGAAAAKVEARFQPPLTSKDARAWQIGNPQSVKVIEGGLRVSAGPEGNYLLTRRDRYAACSIKLELAAAKGTEAFLALRAGGGPQGWHAITARVWDESGRIKAGMQYFNFGLPEFGERFKDFGLGESFKIEFRIDQQKQGFVLINGERTAGVAYNEGNCAEFGAVGLFVRSGTVVIKSLVVTD